MRILTTIFLCLILTQISCVTDEEPAPASEKIIAEPPQNVKSFCNKVSDDCGSTFSPTYCEFRSPPITGQVYSSRAKNPCIAKQVLYEKLCEGKQNASARHVLTCAPDPTVGECQDLALEKCDNEEKPMYCIAVKYNGRNLHTERAPKAWGRNLCSASNDLLVASCRAHLRPSLISELKCETTNLLAKCPTKIPQCQENYEPHICELELESDEKKLSAFGENECLAKFEIQKQLCQLEINPDKISDATCDHK